MKTGINGKDHENHKPVKADTHSVFYIFERLMKMVFAIQICNDSRLTLRTLY